MIKEVLKYPDRKLKEISKEVTRFDEKLERLLDDMYDTMINYNGIGLAAIQIGVAKRVLLLNLPREDDIQYREDLMEVINPVITEHSGEMVYQEGCLSVPDLYEDVKRNSHIRLTYQNRYGETIELEATDLKAVALQHEIDHLNGKLFIERLPMLKRKKFEKEWKKAHKQKR